MEKDKDIELVFTAWNAWVNADNSSRRGKDFVRPNFEDLFFKWKQLGASFDDLYENWLPKAVKAHQPKAVVAKNVYLKLKKTIKIEQTEKEFVDDWNERIENTATEVFFEIFPPPRLDVDDEPKVFGSMSAKEYALQRRHADQYSTIDTTELKRMWKEQQYNTNIDDLMGNILEDSNETNE